MKSMKEMATDAALDDTAAELVLGAVQHALCEVSQDGEMPTSSLFLNELMVKKIFNFDCAATGIAAESGRVSRSKGFHTTNSFDAIQAQAKEKRN